MTITVLPHHVISQCARETRTRDEAWDWMEAHFHNVASNVSPQEIEAAVDAVETYRGSSDYNVNGRAPACDTGDDDGSSVTPDGAPKGGADWADGSVFDWFADMGIEPVDAQPPEDPFEGLAERWPASDEQPAQAAPDPLGRDGTGTAPGSGDPKPAPDQGGDAKPPDTFPGQSPGEPPPPPATLPVYETCVREVRRVEWPVSKVTGTEAAAKLVWTMTQDYPTERLLVVYLNLSMEVAGVEVIGQGGVSQVTSHPREVFQGALAANAHGIVMGHNHPSGDPTPSSADRETTERMVRAGHLIGIPVLDHVVVTPQGDCASIRDNHPECFLRKEN